MMATRAARAHSLLTLLLLSGTIWPVPDARAAPVNEITVEASRQQAELRRSVDTFVSHALVPLHYNDSYMRWDHAICPLVAGMPREAGEFILRRVSTVAVSVHAPIGRQDCKPNLFIVFAAKPDILLKLWWGRNPRLFDTYYGIDPVKRFIDTPRPVRVWRNAYEIDADSGAAFTEMLSQSTALNLGQLDYPVHSAPSSLGSRLTRTVVRNIGSAIIVVDSAEVTSLSIGQLADYVALIGLAEVNENGNVGAAPTLLQLFRVPDADRPSQMTDWDLALLRGLYSTPQESTVQLSQIETYALREIMAHSPR